MPIYNLIKYSSNYSQTTGSLWFYSKDEKTNFGADVANTNNFESFECKAKLLGDAVGQPARNRANGVLKNSIITIPLKYVSSF